MNNMALGIRWGQRVALSLGILTLVACGGGGGDDPGAATTPVSNTPPPVQTAAVQGVAAKGLLVGATVEVFEANAFGFIDGSTPLATTTTDANGQFSLANRPTSGNLILITRGGVYVDESDPEPDFDLKRRITLTPDQGFEALLPAGQDTLAITPFSQMVLARARAESVESNRFAEFFAATRTRAVEVFGFDPISDLPADPIAPATTASAASRQYAMALGGFANLVNATAISVGLRPNFPVVDALLTDLVDGRFDTLDFGTLITVDTDNGPQSLPSFDFNEQIARFRNNNFEQYQNTILVTVEEAELEDDIVLPPPDNSPPVVDDIQFEVDEGGTLEIAAPGVLFDASDPDGDTLTVNPTPITAPAFGELQLASDGAFTYIHNGGEQTSDSFTFEVSDGNDHLVVATATIVINPIDDPAALSVNNGLTLNEGTSAPLGASNLLATDPDSPDGDIEFIVVQSPSAGDLLRQTGETAEILGNGDSFTQTELTQEQIVYVHNGTETTSDSFDFDLDNQELLLNFAITIVPVNDPPIATADSVSAAEDSQAFTVDVLANDIDVDGPEPLSIIEIGAVPTSSGVLSIAQGAQSLSFQPAVDFNGTVNTSYTVSDGAATATAALNITITPVNDAPVASPDAYQTDEDTPLSVDAASGVLSNDNDVDGDTLTAVLGLLTSPGGDLTLNSDGSFTFTPAQDFTGDARFQYRADDGQDQSATTDIIIGVNGQNDNPVAVDDDIQGVEEDSQDNVLDVLANDSDIETPNTGLTIVAINGYAGQGDVNIAQDSQSLLYTPASNFNGVETLTYTITDGDGGQATANVSITVDPVNDNPTAVDDSFAVDEGQTLTVPPPGVLGNDTDIDGDTLSVDTTPISGPLRGSLTLNADGSFEYFHDGSEINIDQFAYRLLDGNGGTSSATVTINITPFNDAPVIVINGGLTLDEGTSGFITGFATGNLLTEDDDNASSELTYTLLSVPQDGTLKLLSTVLEVNDTFTQEDLDEAGLEYVHNGAENASDGFDFSVTDPQGAGPSAETFEITINPVNDNPVANDDFVGNASQSPATTNPARDIQPAWDTRSGSELIVFRTNRAPSTQSENLGQTSGDGSIAEDNLLIGPDTLFGISAGKPGWVGGTPNVVLNAAQGSHRYLEFNVDTNAQRNVLTIPGGGGGGWMTISRDGSTALWRFSQSGGAGQTELRVAPYSTLNGQQANAVGTVVRSINLGTTGEFNDVGSLTPDGSAFVLSERSGNGNGRDLFLRNSSDGSLIRQLTNSGASLDESNNAPEVSPDGTTVAFSRLQSGANAFNLFTIGIDGTGETQLTFDNDTTEFEPSWSPNGSRLAFRRVDTQANGGHDGSIADNNNIWVMPAAPTTSAGVNEGESLFVEAPGVLGNDVDADGDPLAATQTPVVAPQFGSLQIDPDGAFFYSHNGTENFEDSFVYQVTDGQGGSDTATVFITINSVNDAPVATDDTATVAEDSSNNVIDLVGNDIDDDGDVLAIDSFTGAEPGASVVLANNNRAISYSPPPDFFGDDVLTYTVTDGNGGADTGTVTITVNGIADSPVANPDPEPGLEAAYTTDEDTTLVISDPNVGVLNNDVDADGDTITVSNADTLSAAGVPVDVQSDGTFTYDLQAQSGPFFQTLTDGDTVTDSFNYFVSDGTTTPDSTTVTVTVNGVNDAPANPVISTVRINNGDSVQINTFLLRTTDVDTADSGITYDLTAVPTDGGLLLSGTPLNVGESFTQADLVAGTVDYLNETQPTGGQDSFSFNLSNGGAASNPNGPFTFTIDVTPPNNPPQATVPAQPIVGNITTRTAIDGLAVSDPDEGSGFESSEVEVVLTTTEAIGAFNVIDATEGGLNFVGDSNFTDTVTIRGSLADINATFSTPGAVEFTPPFKRSGLFELSLTIDDLDPRGPLANTQTQDLLLNIFSLNEANTTIAGQIPDGNLGRTATNVGDINGDGFDDIAMVQDNASEREVIVFYGASEPFNASPAGADGNNGFVVTSTLFSTSERFGEAVIGHDVDRDGFNDLIIGDPGADLASIDTDDGRVYVLFGSATIPAFNDLSDEEPGTIRYEVLENNDFDQVGAEIGTALAVGDINGDAFPDLLVGAPGAFNTQSESLPGAVFVLFGDAETGTNFNSPPISGLEPDLAILGPQTGDGFGSAVAAGDVNGDAIDDLIVGAPTATRQGVSASGSVYAVAGRDRAAFGSQQVVVNSLLDNAEDGFEYQGSNDANGELGGSVAFADDINGDGFGDFIVGEPGVMFDPGDSSTRRGMAHVLFGTNMNPDPATIPGGYFRGELDGSNGYFVYPPASEASFFGDSVGGGGDINGDGLRDVIIGYPAFAATGVSPQDGTAYLLFGGTPDASSLDLSGLDGRNGFVIESEEPGTNDDRTGEMVTTLGDFNGDGFDDLLVSVPLVDTPISAAGRVHVINGANFLGLNMSIGDDQANALPVGNSFIIAGDGDDTLGSVSANSVLRGGRGNDSLDYSNDLLADGGSNDATGMGVDTLLIGSEEGNPVRINNVALPRHQRARNIELISLGDTALAVDALEVQSLTDGRNTLRVDGTGNPANAVATDDAWQPGQIVDIGGTQYHQYFSGGATLLVDVNVDRSGIILAAQTVLLSRTSNDTQNDQPSTRPRVSGNGQYVVFESSSSTTDDNGVTPIAGIRDIYRKSLDTDLLQVVTTDGMSSGNSDSEFACVSHSGNLVAFATTATNLPTTRADNGNSVTVSGRQVVLANLAATPNPSFEIVSGLPSEGFIQFASVGNECEFSPDERYVYFVGESGGGTTPSSGNHIWRYDIATGSGLDRTAVSYDADTEFSYCESDGETSFGCQGIGVSADGNVVAFAANADFPGDTNPLDVQGMQSGYDIVIRDANQGGFEIAANGTLGTTSTRPSLSGDGQLLVFESDSDFSGEGTASADVYLLDRVSGVFSTVNTDPNGLANGDSAFGSNPNPDGVGDPRISTDGRFVVFTSRQDGLDGAAYPTPEPGPSFSTFVKRVPATLPSVDGGLQSPIFRAHRNLLGDFFSTFDGESINNPAVGRAASINFDGSAIVFSDTANNIVSSDTNGQNADVFGFLNPLFEDDLVADLDGDGLSNQNELANLQTNPANTDTDGDRLKDNVEVGFAGDPSVYDIGGDTDPTNPDTDGDLLGDGLEFELTGAELTSVVGSGADPIIFVSDGADGTGDGTGYGLDALTVAQAAIRTDSGVTGNPVIFVFEEGLYFSIPNLILDGRNDVALIGSMAPGRLYPREDAPSTSLRVDAQRGQRMLTIDSSSNITVRSIEIAFSRPPDGAAGGAVAVLGSQTPSSNILLRSIQLQLNDTTDVGGGGLAVLNESDAVLENSVVTGNDVATRLGANLHGGGILVAEGSRLDIINSSITDNALDESSGDGGITFGGGLAVMGGSTVAVLDSVISQNGIPPVAADVGGGIYVSGSSISVENTEISDNVLSGNSSGTIPGYGGGVYLDAIGTADFINAKILRNQALGEFDATALGGGIALANGGELNVTDSLISSNRATAQGTSSSANGGGIYSGFSGNNVKIVGSIISDNVAESDGFNARGGGFYTNSSGTLSIQDSQFLGNAAPSAGGGIWISDGGNFGTDMTVLNNLFTGNVSGSGGGIWARQLSTQGNNLLLQNNTVAYNQVVQASAGGGINVASSTGSTLSVLDNIVVANDDNSVGTTTADENYTGPVVTAAPDVLIDYNLNADQAIGDNAFAPATNPQWLQGFYLSQAGNPLVGLILGAGGGGDETRTTSNLGHPGLLPNDLAFTVTTSVLGVFDGGNDQKQDNLDIGYHHLQASAGALMAVSAINPEDGGILFCNFSQEFGNSAAITVRPRVGTLESQQGRLISARSLTPGAALRSRTQLDPLGAGDSVLAVDRGNGSYTVFFDGNASFVNPGSPVTLEFFEDVPGNSLGTLTYVTDSGFSCGS